MVNEDGLIFIDIETTGLRPHADAILEVAVVTTDKDLEPVARYHRVMHYGKAAFQDIEMMDDVVVKMHTANGLIEALQQESNHELAIDVELHNWFDKHVPLPKHHFRHG